MMGAEPKATDVISVLIVEDHHKVGEMLAHILRDEEDIVVLDWVNSVAEAHRSVAARHVDVVLMDYNLPDGNGVTAAAQIRREHPDTRVLIVTGVADDHVLKDAEQAGCSGYLFKPEAGELLAIAVRGAHAGSIAESTVPGRSDRPDH